MPIERVRNPKHQSNFAIAGYQDMGWQLMGTEAHRVACREAGHQRREVDNSLYQNRCTDVIRICDTCKMYDHTDMSD